VETVEERGETATLLLVAATASIIHTATSTSLHTPKRTVFYCLHYIPYWENQIFIAMWSRVDYSILPASSTKHLSIENRNFALALRKSTTDQTKSPQRSKNVLLADDDSFLEARLTRKNQQKPCNVSSCIIIEHDIAVAYKEVRRDS
jgi:hypothetical protein